MSKMPASYEEYLKIIKDISTDDRKNRFSRTEAELSANEKKLDNYMTQKRKELIGDRYTYDAYAPALMFNRSINDIEANELFQMVFQKLPCGGNLHIHTSSTLCTDKFLNILADDANVYVYWNPNAGLDDTPYLHGKFLYLTKKPEDEHFINFSSIAEFEDYPFNEVKKLITFIDDRIDNIEYIWDGFNDYFTRVGSVLSVKNVYAEYYKQAFIYQAENNNDYIEIRAGASELVDNNDAEVFGTKDPQKALTDSVPSSITALYDAYKSAKKESEACADLKVKAIISLSRKRSANADADINRAIDVLKHIPAWRNTLKDDENEFIVGFDLVSEEDINHKTDDYAKKIINAVKENNLDVNFYFHDGESNWADNNNMHAAYALGAKRIGHGLNLYNFPALMDKVRDEKICLEVCPISNQMLRYMKDLRIHPIAQYMQRGIPCVVCSDDPQIFETVGTYYDLWEVYHGAFIDLLDLKALIRNSYTYSAMNETEKQEKINKWEYKWKKCVDQLVADLKL